MKKNEQQYICTRSRLAAVLMEAGQKCQEITNPWNPAYKAWTFPMNDTVVFMVASFYRSEGKPVPQYIRNAAKAFSLEV